MKDSRDNIRPVAITGFSVIALLMLSIAGIALYEMAGISERAAETATHAQRRIAAIDAMRDAVSQRITSLRLIAASDDPFVRDQERMHFLVQGSTFIAARKRFEALSSNSNELRLLKRFREQLATLQTSSNETIDELLEAIDNGQASQVLEHAIDERQRLLGWLDGLQRAELTSLSSHANDCGNYNLFLLITALALLLSAVTTHSVVTRASAHQRQQLHRDSHDELTNLLNRKGFEAAVAEVLRQEEPIQAAILYLDLDQFKLINETAGHHVGDELLRELAAHMKQEIRATDLFARLSGDEFAVLLNHCPPRRVKKIANKLRRAVKRYQHDWDDQQFEVGVSIGAIAVTDNSTSVEQLLAAADKACYLAKEQGRNQVYFADQNDAELEKRSDEMLWVNQINEALRSDRFVLYHQPIVATQPDSEIAMIEVLVRMVGTNGEVIPPNDFLPAAERFDLMTAIDKWVVRHTLAWMARNLKRSDPLEVSINICAKSASNQSFQKYVMMLISRLDVDPSSICFEITETMAMNDFAGARSMIEALGQLGVRFAIDDFGSGMASFAYLKHLDVDYLKIDGDFVRDIENDRVDHEIVKSMNQIGHVMGKKTIAEFVENDAIRALLQQLGVNFVQGYGIAKPRPLEDFGHVPMNRITPFEADSELLDEDPLPA